MLFILLIPLLFAELYLTLKVIEIIGAGWSVVWIVGAMMAGITLLKNTHYAIFSNISNVSKGKFDLQNFQNASMAYMAGAVLLIIPGILSDIFGVAALLYTIYLQFMAKITPAKTNFNHTKGEDDVIDVEVIDSHDRSDSHS